MAATFDRPSAPTQNPYSDPSMMDTETDKSFSQSTLQQTSQKQIQGNDAAILQREREINDIAKGIIELADIFKDLQTMVIDQGTMLDRIDYNVERMAVNVKAADKELVMVCWHLWYSRASEINVTDAGNGIPTQNRKAKDYPFADHPGCWDVYRLASQTKAKRPSPGPEDRRFCH